MSRQKASTAWLLRSYAVALTVQMITLAAVRLREHGMTLITIIDVSCKE